jgi:hypothetical protein
MCSLQSALVGFCGQPVALTLKKLLNNRLAISNVVRIEMKV